MLGVGRAAIKESTEAFSISAGSRATTTAGSSTPSRGGGISIIIASKADLARSAAACMVDQYATLFLQHGSSSTALTALVPLFDVIADLPEGIAVTPDFAADKAEALQAAKELLPGHRFTVVLKEGEPGS
jgi:hypothetical protein